MTQNTTPSGAFAASDTTAASGGAATAGATVSSGPAAAPTARIAEVTRNTLETRIRLKVNLVPQALNVRDFARALRDCRGASPVLLEFQDDRDACVVYLNDFRVDPSVPGRLQSRLAEVVPLEALEIVC